MADGSRVAVNLPVVTSLECLVAEEVDVLVVDSREILGGVGFSFHVLQAISLVPTGGEDIERNLSANGVAVAQVSIPIAAYSQRTLT